MERKLWGVGKSILKTFLMERKRWLRRCTVEGRGLVIEEMAYWVRILLGRQ